MEEKEFKFIIPKKFSLNNFIFSKNIIIFSIVKL